MIGFVEAYEGHLSTNRLSILHSKFPYIFIDHKGICEVCHLAKHMRPSFQNSFNKVTVSYEMLHLDIYLGSSMSIKSVHGHSYFLTIYCG
jgi:hypothetical protein